MPGRRVECVILAAGSSIRLGKEKALIPLNSRTLVGWLAERVSERGLRPVIVTKSEIEGAVSKDVGKCELVINPDPSRGRTGSLQVGISTLDKSAGKGYRLLVVPVDRPGFSSSTLDRLIQPPPHLLNLPLCALLRQPSLARGPDGLADAVVGIVGPLQPTRLQS